MVRNAAETKQSGGLTYSFSGGDDDALFDIDTDTGVVTFKTAPDFENEGDNNTDNDYEIQVTVEDAGGLTNTQDITINVTDVNEDPTITSLATASVAENQTSAIDVQSTDDSDSEGSGLIYSLTGGADQGLFSIDSSTGVVTFNVAPDFEGPGDANEDNDYEVEVTVTDSGVLTDVQDIMISVTNVNEPPEVANPIADKNIDAFDVFSINLDDVFSDADGDDLELSFGDLPDWLHFDPDTNNLSGIPLLDDVTTTPISVDITADDGEETVTDTFEITVGDPTPVTSKTIHGNDRRNLLFGSLLNDEIIAKGNRDIILANKGNDVISGGDGKDIIFGGDGKDFINGDRNNDIILAGNSNDIVFGDEGKDKLLGHSGNDYLDGGDDNDIIVAGLGNDVLVGGAGRNILVGDRGADIFVIDDRGFDRIFDFEDGTDKFFLGNDVKFADLNFQRTLFGGVKIRLASNNQVLANVSSINVNDIDSSDFI